MSAARMSNLERLVHMANQIARNFEVLGHDPAIRATADHIASFWDPRMKEQIFACLDSGAGLDAIAALAIATLREKGAPRARSEEHTSELQSLMRISYAVFCLKKKKENTKKIKDRANLR